MKRLFITTTNNVDNGKAVEYYGIVSSHIVAGAGFFSDLAAGVSDFFGGRSGSYRRQLESIYDEALDELSDKAKRLGANSILGLKIDIDNISGKGMSMFMITAVGTAAKVIFDSEMQKPSTHEDITAEVLSNEVAKREIIEKLNDNSINAPLIKWEFILRNPDDDYVLPLSRRFFDMEQDLMAYTFDYKEVFQKNFPLFIQMADRDLVIKGLYEGLSRKNGSATAISFIKQFSLFDAKSLLTLVNAGYVKRAISLLGVEQPSYTKTDLQDMKTLVDAFNHLPDVGRIEMIEGGMFSKDGEKFICSQGHKNSPTEEFCCSCGENIKGISRSDLKVIDAFKNRVAILEKLLSE